MTSDAIRAIEAHDQAKLEELARLAPEMLAGMHGRMLDAGLLRPALAYRTADPTTRDRLLEELRGFDGQSPRRSSPDSLRLNHLLTALAWIGDEVVQRVFASWGERPPSWRSALYLEPHAYTTTAGWSLGADGTRRDLYLAAGSVLERVAESSGPVAVLAIAEPGCRFCTNPLGLLFEFDLSSRALAFLPLKGTTFPIPFCHLCSGYGPLAFQVDSHGVARWHERNQRFPVYGNTFQPWDDHRFALGRPLANPFEYAGWVDEDAGHIGGYPGWIQDHTYPACLECSEPMTFLGQVDVSSGGRFYGLVCLPCRVTTSVYQQT